VDVETEIEERLASQYRSGMKLVLKTERHVNSLDSRNYIVMHNKERKLRRITAMKRWLKLYRWLPLSYTLMCNYWVSGNTRMANYGLDTGIRFMRR